MHTIDSQINASQNYTLTEKIVSVGVWEQFHGFTVNIWFAHNAMHNMCLVESYSLEIMIM